MRNHPHFKAYVALASVCLFWGTTYLAIRIALETVSAAVLVSARYLLSGGILLGAGALRGSSFPKGRELWLTALFGVVTLGVGNGCLAYAEEWIPSGLAALFITTSPFWMVCVESLVPGGDRLHGPTVAGMLVGLAGAGLLVWPAGGSFDAKVLGGFLLLQAGCAGWAAGSIAMRRLRPSVHPAMSGAVQQMATGLVFLPPALLTHHAPAAVTWRSGAAVLWLVFFGSIVAYSAYMYALDRLPVAVVSIYTYVNPVVAVVLGWLFYREHFGVKESVAMAVIFLGVFVVKRTARH